MRPLDYMQSKQALSLLLAVGRDSTPTAANAFDQFFYPFISEYVLERHSLIGIDVAKWSCASGSAAPELAPEQLDEAAHRATLTGLRRARASAARFDPALGTAIAWVRRAAAYAYVEVAKELAAERAGLVREPEVLEQMPAGSEDIAETLARQQLLDDLFLVLSDDERRVVALVLKHGYTYKEAAHTLFGSAGQAKKVDRLLQSARQKLAPRWAELRGTNADDPE
jgi:DNA-directed RNA polymerase specialized sigma24 family protein